MKKGILRIALMLAVLLLAVGCVKKSEYEASLGQIDGLEKQLKDCSANGVMLQAALDKERAEVARLQEKIDELKALILSQEKMLKDAKGQNKALSDKLAATVADKAKLKESAEELSRALQELQKRKAEAEARVKEFKDLIAKFKKLIDAGKLEVKIKNGRMVLVLPTDILFASGSADLSEEGVSAISEVAAVLATIKEREFQVEGHTDNVPLNSKRRFKNNWELAAKRAMGVVDAMIDAGMSGDVLSAASYGEFRPITSNDTKEGRAANRRIDIVIVPDLSKLPGFDELQKAVTK